MSWVWLTEAGQVVTTAYSSCAVGSAGELQLGTAPHVLQYVAAGRWQMAKYEMTTTPADVPPPARPRVTRPGRRVRQRV